MKITALKVSSIWNLREMCTCIKVEQANFIRDVGLKDGGEGGGVRGGVRLLLCMCSKVKV